MVKFKKGTNRLIDKWCGGSIVHIINYYWSGTFGVWEAWEQGRGFVLGFYLSAVLYTVYVTSLGTVYRGQSSVCSYFLGYQFANSAVQL